MTLCLKLGARPGLWMDVPQSKACRRAPSPTLGPLATRFPARWRAVGLPDGREALTQSTIHLAVLSAAWDFTNVLHGILAARALRSRALASYSLHNGGVRLGSLPRGQMPAEPVRSKPRDLFQLSLFFKQMCRSGHNDKLLLFTA